MKRTLFVGAAFVLLSGLSVLGVHLQALSKIRQHEREVEALHVRARTITRPPLFGPPRPGNAWDIYEHVAATLGNLPPIPVQNADDAEIALSWGQHEQVFARVQEGLRCTQLSFDPENPVELVSFHLLENYLDGGAAYLQRVGRHARAFDWLTTELGFAQDMIGRMSLGSLYLVEERAVGQGLTMLESHALSADELEGIGARLDALARARSSLEESLGRLEILERKGALKGQRFKTGDPEALPVEWRHLWLPSVARAATLNDIAAYYRRLHPRERTPLLQRKSATEALPWEPHWASALYTIYFPFEVRCLTLRAILRAAVAVAWHMEKAGRVPEKLSDIPGFVPDAETEGLWSYSAGVFTYPSESKTWTVRRR